MAVEGDIVQVTFEGTVFQQTWQLVQMFRFTSVGVGGIDQASWQGFLEGLNANFEAMLTAGYKAVLTTQWQYTNVRAENLFRDDEIGQYIRPTPVLGTGAGDAEATYQTYVYKVGSKVKGMRPGFKRMAGVVEAALATGGEILAAQLTTLQAFGTAFGAQWNVTYAPLTAVNIVPVILKRIYITGTEEPREYRLPLNQAEAEYYDVGSYSIVNYVSTTNSRKRGRGI